MKTRVAGILLFLLVILPFSAQTQQGVVKTRGRMVNGVLQPGKGLSGATVQVAGRQAVVSQGAGGNFSFPVSTKTFVLQSVQKKGYQLVDADATRKLYHYSENTLYLVMDTPEQQMEDLLEAEERISKTLRQQLKKAHLEIQQLRDKHQITEEEYCLRITQLMQRQLYNQNIVADMAKAYSQIDFDQIDDLHRMINYYITTGELQKADSLLNTMGDINTDISAYRKLHDINTKEGKELNARMANLDKSIAFEKRQLEELAQRCYNKFVIFRSINRDSMSFYIELRAQLDDSRIDWHVDAAKYLKYSKPKSAIKHARMALKQMQNSDTNANDYAATCYYVLGTLNKNVDSSLFYINKSLNIWESLLNKNREKAGCHVRIASCYAKLGKYEEYKTHFNLAYNLLSTNYGNKYRDIGSLLDYNVSVLHSTFNKLEEAEKAALNALNCWREIYKGGCEDTLDIGLQGYVNALSEYEYIAYINGHYEDLYYTITGAINDIFSELVAHNIHEILFYIPRCALLLKKYKEADYYASLALSILSRDTDYDFFTWHRSHHAFALLFQGKTTEAEQIFRQNKDELKEELLNDFRLFEETGIIPKEREDDAQKFKKLLNEY